MNKNKRSCVVGCGGEVTLYAFPDPEKDLERRNKWIILLGVILPVPKYLYACKNHFSLNMRNRVLLKSNAIPDMNLVVPSTTKQAQDDNYIPCSLYFNKVPSKSTQTDSYISEFSPRKRKYIGELEKVNSTIKKLKEENDNLKMEMEKLRNSVSGNNFNEDLYKRLPSFISQLVKNALSNQSRDPQGKRYERQFKLQCLGLFFVSPVGYRYLKHPHNLPSEKTLQAIVAEWPLKCGISPHHLKALELRTRGLSEAQKYVSVCADEISLKTHLHYEPSYDLIFGLEDFGEIRYPNIAKYALVFMVQGLGGKAWRQPIAYYLVNANCEGIVIKEYLVSIIEELQRIGLNPCHFVSDQGSNLYSLIKLLRITRENPYFQVNNKKIFVFSDVPHLLKSTRNCLCDIRNKVEFNGKTISWSDVIYFYEEDSKSPIRCAPKLNDIHMYQNNFEKQRVYPAAQCFSCTVAAGMSSYFNNDQTAASKAPTTLNTVEFILFMDDLFNIFNSSCVKHPKKSKEAFCGSEYQINFLKKAIKLFESIKITKKGVDKTNAFSFIKGWIMNIYSLLMLWEYLKTEQFPYLLTRKMCQDSLELFFGQIRGGLGCTSSVTPYLFCCKFRKHWGLKYVNVVAEGNCEEIEFEEDLSLWSSTLVNEQHSNFENLQIDSTWYEHQNQTELHNLPEIAIDIETTESQFLFQNAMAYFSGWLYLKHYKRHKCLNDLPIFEDTESSPQYIFTIMKQIEKCNLVKAPELFITYIHELEKRFKILFNEACHRKGLVAYLYERMTDIEPYKCCLNADIKYMLTLFIRVRIYFVIKSFNQKVKNKKFKPKYLTMAHL